MERLAEFLRGHRLRVLAAAGLWLAAATFVRPIAYYLPLHWLWDCFWCWHTYQASHPATRTRRWDPGLPPQRQEPSLDPAYAGSARRAAD